MNKTMNNKTIRGNQSENSKVLSQYIAAQIDLAREKKYGKAVCTFEVIKEPSAQDIINECEDADG